MLMKFKGMRKLEGSSHISRYDIEYETDDGRYKKYEIVSRDPNISGLEDLQSWRSKTVVIIGISPENDKILLNKEFRMAVGDWIYNFPSGMIDEGELPTQAATRELKEETGLTLEKRLVRLKSSYNAPGITNETSSCVLAIVSGEISKSDSPYEEIIAGWYTREQVKTLLKTSKMSARTQLFCFAWVYGGLTIDKLAKETNDYGDGHLW